MGKETPSVGSAMLEKEARSLLESEGHGVLCLGADDRGYGVPISYAYDPDGTRIVLQFVNGPDSKKQRFANATDEVTLTVYNYESVERWESVVVTGTLHPLSKDEVSKRFASLFFSKADDAAGDRRWIDAEDVERQWYEVRISDVEGRHTDVSPRQKSRPD